MNSWIRELGFPVVRVVLEPPSGGDPNNTVSFFYSEAVSNRLQSQVGRVLVIVLGVHLNPLKDIMLHVFFFSIEGHRRELPEPTH